MILLGDLPIITASLDWLELNYYTRNVIRDDGSGQFPYAEAVSTTSGLVSQKRAVTGWEIYPQGFSYFLKHIQQKYSDDLPLTVTENGVANHDIPINGVFDDQPRIDFFHAHMQQLQATLGAGVPVKGYFAWSSLPDNFEVLVYCMLIM